MSLNYKTVYLGDSSPIPLFESPRVMRRIFFGVYIVAKIDPSFQVNVSFGDQQFLNPLCLTYCRGYYEFAGPDIPQGNVFAKMINFAYGTICTTEILK